MLPAPETLSEVSKRLTALVCPDSAMNEGVGVGWLDAQDAQAGGAVTVIEGAEVVRTAAVSYATPILHQVFIQGAGHRRHGNAPDPLALAVAPATAPRLQPDPSSAKVSVCVWIDYLSATRPYLAILRPTAPIFGHFYGHFARFGHSQTFQIINSIN